MTIPVETPNFNTPDLPTDISHFCPRCEPDGLAEQNIPVYIPDGDKEPDALQAGQTQITDTTPRFVVTDDSVGKDTDNCSDGDVASEEDCVGNAVNVDKCLNQELGNALSCIIFP